MVYSLRWVRHTAAEIVSKKIRLRAAHKDLELDVDLVLHLDGAAADADGLDAEIGLLEDCLSAKRAALARYLDRYRLGYPVQRKRSGDAPGSVAGFFDARGLKLDLAIVRDIERHVLHVFLDLHLRFRVDLGIGTHAHFRGFDGEFGARRGFIHNASRNRRVHPMLMTGGGK